MDNSLCDLIVKMYDIFKILRVLAFLGAAFILAKYAWDAISTGKIGDKAILEGSKSVGISMLVGFILLFSIGVILSVLMSGHVIDCADKLKGWL